VVVAALVLQRPRRDVELRKDGALSSTECEVVLRDPVNELVNDLVDRRSPRRDMPGRRSGRR
jgi:hypothetical protein